MNLTAKWIWRKENDYNQYNLAIRARRSFRLNSVKAATIAITADSWYRLFINGEWVGDGPCRSWPEHYQYDVIDVTSHLRPGVNEIEVVARYFGVGTFHQIPRQAGLLAQLEVTGADNKKTVIGTDGQWDVANLSGLVRNTPKQSVQMEALEQYDARVAPERFRKAEVLFSARRGPWKDLHPRDCALMTRTPFAPRRFLQANVVRKDWMCYGLPLARLVNPGLIEANNYVSLACAVATVVVSKKAAKVRIEAPAFSISVNGRQSADGVYSLRKGANFLFAPTKVYFSHWAKDTSIRFVDTEDITLENPVQANHPNPWCFVSFDEFRFVKDDLDWRYRDREPMVRFTENIRNTFNELLQKVVDVESFNEHLGSRAVTMAPEDMLMDEPYEQFLKRQVIGDAREQVDNPGGLMYDNGEWTVIRPDGDGDIELVYDLGEQNCGYYDFDLIAPEGTVVDVFGVEYIAPDGAVQHTAPYRNGMRYVCSGGVNRYLSLKRRSQRYLFITLRNQTGPVRIRKFQLVESTYPVEYVGEFACSNSDLDRIWEISARTLKLCMEDTFTDCPLYEQTHWVGDARNEAIFAFTAFGAADLAARCIRLTGQSLERFPITGCQTPSAWEVLLPAWSFLWGISVLDYYRYTADRAFLEEVWPCVMQNLEGAAKLRTDRGLFSGPFWNMFDWTGTDQERDTVLHNSMFFVGAIDAALECADVLKDKAAARTLRKWRGELVGAINALWDDEKGAYPDSIHEDGTISPSIAQHTSFLALLYDIVPELHKEQALRNVLDPPEGMIRVGSPFAVMYLYEALEKLGLHDRIVELIYENYLPMLQAGATTVWETFSTGSIAWDQFPTRSHCHAWSSAPVHFLNRIILGIVPTQPGGRAITISPRLQGLDWARGRTATIKGPVSVAWRKDGDMLRIKAEAPKGVALRFVRNDTHDGLTVEFNGRRVG